MGYNASSILFVSVLLIAGSLNGLNGKWQYQTCVSSVDSDELALQSATDRCPPGQRHFNKPWVLNWLMFWGELSLLPVYFIKRTITNRRRRHQGKLPKPGSQLSPFVFLLPAFCDLFGTGLSCVGLLYVPAAVAGMMRGSMVIFSAILSVLFLKKRLLGYHYVSLLLTVIGVCLVSYAAAKDGSQNSLSGVGPQQTFYGIACLLLGVLCNGFQFVFEEYLLSDSKVSAQLVVGVEGAWGVGMNGILLWALSSWPGSDNGAQENGLDTLTMYTGEGSSTLWVLSLLYMFCVATSQLAGMTITKKLSAVVRCLISNLQVMLVWGTALALYYGGFPQYGSPWTTNSWFQLAGFAVMVLGTLLYNEVWYIPGFTYMQEDELMPAPALWSPKTTDHGGAAYWESPSASTASPSSPAKLSPGLEAYLLQTEPLLEEAEEREADQSEFVIEELGVTRQVSPFATKAANLHQNGKM